MPRKSPVVKAIKRLAFVFGAAFGCSWISELICEDDESTANKLGLSQKALKSFFGVTSSVLGEQFGDLTAKLGEGLQYGLNENLESAVKAAYRDTLYVVRKTFTRKYNIEDPQFLEQLKFFTDHLYDILNNNEHISEIFEKHHQLDPVGILEQLFAHQSVSYPQISEEGKEGLRAYFVWGFKVYYPHFFTEQLKTDEKARTVYFKKLMESVIIYTKDLPGQLENLKSIAIQVNVSLAQVVNDLKAIGGNLELSSAKLELLEGFLVKNIGDIKEQLEILRELAESNAEPFLDNQIIQQGNIATHSSNSFDYRTQSTRFLGRWDEKYKLWKFLENEAGFSWMMITGPGGMGKSRLAQEFCSMLRNEGYHAGFYRLIDDEHKNLHNWEKWRFRYPTFMVIDYALSKPKEVHEFISTLYKKCSQENHKPVRVLLLDREVTTDWENRMKTTELNLSGFLQEGQDQPILKLSEFGDENCWQLILQANEENNQALSLTKDEAFEIFEKHGWQQRPLYAFFAGVALAEGHSIRDWNIKRLLDFHLTRLEHKVWSTVPVFLENPDAIKKLLVINTLTRNLSIGQVKPLLAQLGVGRSFSPEAYTRLSDKHIDIDTRKEEWLGLMPDIMGEYFVLSYLKKMLHSWDEGEESALSLLKTAWQLKADDVWWMSWLCLYDFRKDFVEECSLLLDERLMGELNGENAVHASKFLSNVIKAYAEDPPTFEIAEKLYRNLEQLAEKNPSMEVMQVKAVITGFMSSAYSKIEDRREEAVELYRLHASELREQYPDSVRISQVATGFNLVHALVGIEKWTEFLESVYEDMKRISAAVDLDKGYFLTGTAALKLVTYYTKEKIHLDRIDQLYEDVLQFARRQSQEPVRGVLAGVTNHIITYYRKENILHEKAIELYNELKRHENTHHLDKLLHYQGDIGSDIITWFSGLKGRLGQSLQLYKELKLLSNRQDIPELHYSQAWAAAAIIMGFDEDEKNLKSYQQLYRDLKRKKHHFKEEEQERFMMRAAYSLIYEFAGRRDCREWLDEVYDDLKQLFFKNPNPDLKLTMARASYCLMAKNIHAEDAFEKLGAYYEDINNIDNAENNLQIKGLLAESKALLQLTMIKRKVFPDRILQLYNEIKQLTLELDTDSIWICLAGSARNMIGYFPQEPPLQQQADEIYAELKEIGDRRNREEIRRLQAGALHDFIRIFGETENSLDKASAYYKELTDLANEVQLPEIRVLQGESSHNLVVAALRLKDFEAAINHCDELEKIVEGLPGHKINILFAKICGLLMVTFSVYENYRHLVMHYFEKLKNVPVDKETGYVLVWQIRAIYDLRIDLQKLEGFEQELEQLDKTLAEKLGVMGWNEVKEILNNSLLPKELVAGGIINPYEDYRKQVMLSNDPVERIKFAQVTYQVIEKWIVVKALEEETKRIYQYLMELPVDDESVEIYLWQAKACVSFIEYFFDNDLATAVRVLEEDLLPLATEKRYADIWLEAMKALALFVVSFNKNSSPADFMLAVKMFTEKYVLLNRLPRMQEELKQFDWVFEILRLERFSYSKFN